MRGQPFRRLRLRTPRRVLRRSMAARMLTGGLVFTIALIAGVSGLLLVSRNQQTETGALSNADNRAGVAEQLISRVAEPQAQYAATEVASLSSLQQAMAAPDPAAALAAEFSNNRIMSVPGVDIVVLDMHGAVLYTTECDSIDAEGATHHPPTPVCEAAAQAHVSAAAASVRQALATAARSICQAPRANLSDSAAAQCPAGLEGTEQLQAAPAFDVAVPVYNARARTYAALGAVVYSSTLRTEFSHFGPVIGYTPVFLSAGSGASMLRFSGAAYAPAGAPAVDALLAQTRMHATTQPGDTFVAHAIYTVPGVGEVAGSFVPLAAPGGGQVAGFLGVEVPLALFAAGTAQDERTIGEIAITAMVLVALLVLLFVDRFVRRPVARLERGVGRIAAGDYTTDIPVTSEDELGRLATSVNRMREQISGYVRHIDGSLERLQDVSRALTTTTGGVDRLQDAVLHAAAASTGGDATAMLFSRRGDDLFIARMHGQAAPRGLDVGAVRELLDGSAVRADAGNHHVLAVPMFFQAQVTGALVLLTATPVFESDQRTLEALANNAAVALENTRLFEQERHAVQRLQELNRMKSDFLSTAQHELRTPVLAIQGQLDLLTAAWERWDEATKLDTMRDIDISTKLLGELVETIVDFSLLSADTVELRQQPVDVATAVQSAAGAVRAHFKSELPVSLHIDIGEGAVVHADATRFTQVIRALLDNAVKFTPEGGSVALYARPEHAGRRCRIDVIDTGIGIAPDALPRIFDRFFQEDNSRTRRYGGMGMGLALVRRLCEAHGATVSVESAQGTGTRFTVVWPLSTEPVPERRAGFFLVEPDGRARVA